MSGCQQLALPEMSGYDEIVVNHSGGKDSMCAAAETIRECDRQGVPRSRVTFQYNDLGPRVVWPSTDYLGQHMVDRFGHRLGSKELVETHAKHYGVRFAVTRHSGEGDLLDRIQAKGMFPDADRRWCTAGEKRGPGFTLLTALVRALNIPRIGRRPKRRARILYIFGFRAQESAARRKRVAEPLVLNEAASNDTVREVWDWYPIHNWSVDDVWADIKASGLEYHWAYDAGMTRLSCTLCVLASKADLLLAAYLRPDVALDYLRVERTIGHTFRKDLPMAEILRLSQAEYGWDAAPAALAWSRARVVRCFQRYSAEQRANLAASHRAGHRQRTAVGEFFYTHPDVPDVAYPTRKAAAEAGVRWMELAA